MSDGYKLVFRGEVLEGQHAAVVRKRLAKAAAFAEEHLNVLFSGRLVVVKRQVDAATAAQFQALFADAGARLRVLPADVVAALETETGSRSEALTLLPSGSPMLRDDERHGWQPRDIDTSSLSLAEAGASLTAAKPSPPVQPPDVSHLALQRPD